MTVVRREYKHIDELTADFPDAIAIFNCTGLGARDLGGVADDSVYPTKVELSLFLSSIFMLNPLGSNSSPC